MNTVVNVDASDYRCRCIYRIIVRNLKHVVSQPYRMAATRPGLCAAITLSSSLDSDLLGYINHTREKERNHYTIMSHTYLEKVIRPATD